MKNLEIVKNTRNNRVYLLIDENEKVIDYSASVAVLKKKYGKENAIEMNLDKSIAN